MSNSTYGNFAALGLDRKGDRGKTLTGKQREKLIKQFGHVPTKEEIFQKIEESQERLVSSLAGMWQTAPDDPKIKGKILEAMEKAMKIRQNVYKTGLKEE